MAGDNETNRKILHMAVGAALLALLYALGRSKLMAVLLVVLLGGLVMINLMLNGKRVPVAGWFIENFERKGVRLPGYSTAWYVSGLLIAATVLHEPSDIAAVICALAFGDGLSAIVGRRGRILLPYNGKKTLEGTAAFAAGSLAAYFFIGWPAIPFAIACAVFESAPIGLDDNFTVPLFAAGLFWLSPYI